MDSAGVQARLEQAEIVLSNGVPLERRLARALHSEGTARLVVREYRRFLVLTLQSAEPVVPSPLLREVWSLHAQDRPAWTGFCETVLLRRLDLTHPGEAERTDPAYDATRAAYARTFGEDPPPSCWPSPLRLHLRRWLFVPVVLGLLWALAGAVLLGAAHVVAGMLVVLACLVWNATAAPLRLAWQEQDALERR